MVCLRDALMFCILAMGALALDVNGVEKALRDAYNSLSATDVAALQTTLSNGLFERSAILPLLSAFLLLCFPFLGGGVALLLAIPLFYSIKAGIKSLNKRQIAEFYHLLVEGEATDAVKEILSMIVRWLSRRRSGSRDIEESTSPPPPPQGQGGNTFANNNGASIGSAPNATFSFGSTVGFLRSNYFAKMANDLQTFNHLITAMMGSNNEERSLAEKTYNEIPIAHKAKLLLQIYAEQSVNPENRSMALVLFRRLLSNDYKEFVAALPPNEAPTFFDQFITFVTNEESPILRKRLADILAEIARNTIDEDSSKQKWTPILQLLEHCSTSDKPSLREVSMQLIENVPNIFGVDQNQYLAGIKQMFHSSLLYGADAQVRSAAVRAYVAFVCDNDENDHVIRVLSELVPDVIQVCRHVLQTEDDDDVPIQCLGDLASSVPKMLTPHLDSIFELCLGTVGDGDKEENYRQSALEVLVSFCESVPGTMRKRGARYLPLLVTQCLNWMTNLNEDIAEWMQTDDANEEDDNEEMVTIGETSLDRVCCAIGGKSIMATLLQSIDQLLKHQDWRYRHAGIMGLSTMGEGCKRQMESLITQIMNDMVIPKINDEHPRVRYAVCNCIGQMCTDFAPTLQKKCHEKIVAALIGTVTQLNVPRVAAHAAAALVNFSEECPKNIMVQYLPGIMEKMESVLSATFQNMVESGKKIVLEQIITTIASIADAAEGSFANYYDRLSQPLKYILSNATSPELKEMRGKTMECLSLIGVAIGREKFRADANEIMQSLLAAGISFSEEDDPELSYMISSWARICKVLGPEFAPYMPHVMPSVMKTAEFQPEISIMDNEEAEGCDEASWNVVDLGDQRSLGIKTAGLEDKLTACEMLVSFARDLGTAFVPYVEQVLNLMIPQLKYVFHDGVRSAAAEGMAPLMACVKEQGIEAERVVLNRALPALIEAINKESDLEVLADQIYAIAQLAEEGGARLFTEQDVARVVELLQVQKKRYDERLEQLKQSRKDEEVDEEEQVEMEETYELEAGVLGRMSDTIHYLFVAFEERFLPYFERLNPQFSPLLAQSQPWRDRQWGTCIYDDIIEYGGDAGRRQYQQIFLEPLIRHLVDEYPEIRQAAAYGVGVLAMKGGHDFAHALASAVPLLAESINKPDSRETEEGMDATENAISAVSKILKYNSSAVNTNEVIPAFFRWLPVWQDAEEIPYIYDYFCDLVEQNNPLVLGENNANLSRVFEVILHTFSRGAFEQDEVKEELLAVKQRLVNIVKMLHSNGDIFQGILSQIQLNSHQQEVLQSILSA